MVMVSESRNIDTSKFAKPKQWSAYCFKVLHKNFKPKKWRKNFEHSYKQEKHN